jgi:hypothetical protein
MTPPKNPHDIYGVKTTNVEAWNQGYAAGLLAGEARLARALRMWMNGQRIHESWTPEFQGFTEQELLDWLTTRAKRRKP